MVKLRWLWLKRFIPQVPELWHTPITVIQCSSFMIFRLSKFVTLSNYRLRLELPYLIWFFRMFSCLQRILFSYTRIHYDDFTTRLRFRWIFECSKYVEDDFLILCSQTQLPYWYINYDIPIAKNARPKIIGISRFSSISKTMKPAEIINLPAFTNISSSIPYGCWIVRSTSCSDTVVGLASPNPSFLNIENDIKCTLAPKSNKALSKL